MQKGCSLSNTYLTGVVNDQTYSVFFFVCFNGKVTARNAIISSISHLMEEMEQSSIGGGQVSWRQKPSTCFVLRGERVASSSRFLARSKLQRTVEIRTIEMILKSTIMGNSTLRTNLLNQNYECMWLHVVMSTAHKYCDWCSQFGAQRY